MGLKTLKRSLRGCEAEGTAASCAERAGEAVERAGEDGACEAEDVGSQVCGHRRQGEALKAFNELL